MDSRAIALAFIALCVSSAFVAWAYLESKTKMHEKRRPLEDAETKERLARIEAAVESIAIEVERISEAQRFSARLAAGRPTEPLLIERPTTPH